MCAIIFSEQNISQDLHRLVILMIVRRETVRQKDKYGKRRMIGIPVMIWREEERDGHNQESERERMKRGG